MISLSGETQYLTFFGQPKRRKIAIGSEKKHAAQFADAYFRISPVFPAKHEKLNGRFDFRGEWRIIFFGPAPPDLASSYLGRDGQYWMSLGLLNNIIVCRQSQRLEQLRTRCRKSAIPFEILEIRDGEIVSAIDMFFPEAQSGGLNLERLAIVHSELSQAVFELEPLIAKISSRGMPIRESIRTALEDYVNQIVRILSDAERDSARARAVKAPDRVKAGGKSATKELKNPFDGEYFSAHGELQKISSGLSRFAAQLCVGIPPVGSHECHYWAHSALGIGTPILGVMGLVEHIYEAIAKKQIPERFATLMDSAFPGELSELAKDRYTKDIAECEPKVMSETSKRPALSLPFFSGRDGFESDAYSISVPVTSLSAANTIRWSLSHVTHEVSHDIVRAVLASSLIPSRRDKNWKQRTKEIFFAPNPVSIGTYIQQRFFRAALAFGGEITNLASPGAVHIDAEVHVDVDELVDTLDQIFDKHEIDIEEVMVHAFDFLYFHRLKSERYISAVWSSWATIPAVERRVPKYIIRTLCALSLHPDAAKNPKYAYTKLLTMLDAMRRREAVGPCCEYALNYLRANREGIMIQFGMQMFMADLVQRFLFSPEFQTELHGEVRRGNQFVALRFDEARLSNPLSFISLFHSPTDEVSSAYSAWMFNCLAHNRGRKNDVK